MAKKEIKTQTIEEKRAQQRILNITLADNLRKAGVILSRC